MSGTMLCGLTNGAVLLRRFSIQVWYTSAQVSTMWLTRALESIFAPSPRASPVAHWIPTSSVPRLPHRLLCHQLQRSLHVWPLLDARGPSDGKPTDHELGELHRGESVGRRHYFVRSRSGMGARHCPEARRTAPCSCGQRGIHLTSRMRVCVL